MNIFMGEKSNSFDDNYNKVSYVTFLDLKMEKVDKWQKFLTGITSFLMLILLSICIILLNILVFYIYKLKKLRKQFFLFAAFSRNFAQYQVPILILIIREIMSFFIYDITKYLANFENPTDKDKYIEIVTKKRLFLEYVNYYFNLYYIAFYKKIRDKCTENDCFSELKNQLMMILITDSIYVLANLFYKIIFLRSSQKTFENKLMKQYKDDKNDLNENQNIFQ